MTPKLILTEAALGLIRHAESDIRASRSSTPRPGRILTDSLGASTDPTVWLGETALLRLISIIEAYVDAVSMHRMSKVVDNRHPIVAKMLDDFELDSTGTWQERKNSYTRYHGFSLESRPGWDAINAGIEVRNCLIHGLGNLTAKQRTQTKLPAIVKRIDVTIGSNRMHLSSTTVSTLAKGCAGFVSEIDIAINVTRP